MKNNSQQQLCIGVCPLCDNPYTLENNVTRHHIFPSYWYSSKGTIGRIVKCVTVCACEKCHEKEFNHYYPMRLKYPWTISQCVQKWCEFCWFKGKNPFEIYPKLLDYEHLVEY